MINNKRAYEAVILRLQAEGTAALANTSTNTHRAIGRNAGDVGNNAAQ